jgi:hypothetical protein
MLEPELFKMVYKQWQLSKVANKKSFGGENSDSKTGFRDDASLGGMAGIGRNTRTINYAGYCSHTLLVSPSLWLFTQHLYHSSASDLNSLAIDIAEQGRHTRQDRARCLCRRTGSSKRNIRIRRGTVLSTLASFALSAWDSQ